ncbi:Uncharacterized protein FWK35_00005396 [Aphis craccivora]|uniref:Uncharacterized protein n=1 Tax=Aphis craccivora TaxID=307492 RepID=A0A6G0ZDW4_APHCR|nr:Uncharacterized protein FWK35_00005396 [Aphis craccivora]
MRIKPPQDITSGEAPSVFGNGYNIMQMGPLPDGNICAYRKERVVGMSTYLNTNTNHMQIKMPQPRDRNKPSSVFLLAGCDEGSPPWHTLSENRLGRAFFCGEEYLLRDKDFLLI